MLSSSHLLSSIGILTLLQLAFPGVVPVTWPALGLSLIFCLLPDLDVLWAKSPSTHHESALHTPFFWVLCSLILFIVSYGTGLIPFWVVILFLVQTIAHLLFDSLTARASGIRLLYPFSQKEYSLIKLTKSPIKSMGMFRSSAKRREIFRYYFRKKSLIAIEIAVSLLGFIAAAIQAMHLL